MAIWTETEIQFAQVEKMKLRSSTLFVCAKSKDHAVAVVYTSFLGSSNGKMLSLSGKNIENVKTLLPSFLFMLESVWLHIEKNGRCWH